MSRASHQIPFTEKQLKYIKGALAAGAYLKDLAARYRCSTSRISRIRDHEAYGEKEQVVSKVIPRCPTHMGVDMHLVSSSEPLLINSASCLGGRTKHMKHRAAEADKRKIWRCSVAGCPRVESEMVRLHGEYGRQYGEESEECEEC